MTKRGVKTGASLPSHYDTGMPAVNFYLAILVQARKDDAELWRDFKETEIYEQGLRGVPDSLETAWWVSEYIKE